MIRVAILLIGIRGITALVVFVADFLSGRLLGVDGKGVLNTLMMLPAMLGLVAALGMDFIVNTRGKSAPEKAASTAIASLPIAFAAAMFIVMLILMVEPLNSRIVSILDGWVSVGMFLALIPLEAFFLILGFWLLTKGKAILYSSLVALRRISILPILLLGYFAYDRFAEVEILAFSFTLMTVILVGFMLSRTLEEARSPLNAHDVWLMLKEGIVAFPGRVAERIIPRASIVVLLFVGTAEDIGIFAAALFLSETVWFVSSSVAWVLFGRPMRGRAARVAGKVLVVSAALGGLVLFFNEELVKYTYGGEFLQVVELNVWIVPGVVMFSLVHVITPLLLEAKVSNLISIINATILIGIIIAGAVGHSIAGVKGMAAVVGVAYVVSSLLYLSTYINISNRKTVVI